MDTANVPSEGQYQDFPYISPESDFIIPAALSFCSTLLVVLFTTYKKFWRCALAKMIFASNLMDAIFFSSKLSVLLHTPGSNTYCLTMRLIFNFIYFSLMIWKACFGHAFYSILKTKKTETLSHNLKYYTLFALVLPFISFVSSIFHGKPNYSEETQSCVDRVYLYKLDWPLMLYIIIPCISTIVLNIIWYIWAYRELQSIKLKKNIKESLTLILYPGVLIVCWLPLFLVQTFVQFGVAANQSAIKGLTILAYLMGFFNALVYVEGKLRCVRRFGKRGSRYFSGKKQCEKKSLNLESESGWSEGPNMQSEVTESFTPEMANPDQSYVVSGQKNESNKYLLM